METSTAIATPTSGPATPAVASVGGPTEAVAEAEGFFASKWFRYGLLILILAFLGFNLFTYLGKATDAATHAVKPVVKPVVSVAKTALDAVEDTVEEAAKLTVTGAEKAVDTVGDVTKQIVAEAASGITAAADTTSKVAKSGLNRLQEATDMSALKDAAMRQKATPAVPAADDSLSSVQARQTPSQAGYCYIGEQGGFRSCIRVSEADMCMSGDIFPTKAICINPSLRE